MSERSIPITLVTGFLGSGKTTAILNYLNHKASTERVAILVNDFGRIGVDTNTLRQAQKNSTVVHQVPGGCVCCTAAVGMTLALMNIIETEDPDRILIEPTGIARPQEIGRVLRSKEFSAKAHLAQVIALVDARRFISGGAETHSVFSEQIKTSDLIVVNFIDRIAEEARASLVESLRSQLNEKQKLITVSRGQIPTDLFRARHIREKIPFTPRLVRINTPSSSVHQQPLLHTSEYSESGQQWSPDLEFYLAELKASVLQIAQTESMLRLKGQFRTENGYFGVQWSEQDSEPTWSITSEPKEKSSFIEIIAKGLEQTIMDHLLKLKNHRSSGE